MKIRTGFVSNSSSSSFIIGIVKSEEGIPFFEHENLPWWVTKRKISDDTWELEIESFTGSTVSCKIKEGEKFISMYGTGPDEDSFFYDEDDYCDYDKINLEDFEENDIEMYEKILKLGGQVYYGAGRDG